MINLAQKSQSNYEAGTVFGSQIALLFLFVLVLLVLISCVRYFKVKQN